MVNEEIVGTEIDYNWILNSEGDLSLVRGSDNLRQAVFLRLSAYLDSLDWAYDFYGSKVKEWLGKNQDAYTRTTLLEEVKKRVVLDPRIMDADIELVDWKLNMIGIHITAKIEDGTTFNEFFIFSDIPRKIENVNSPNWKNTWIDTVLNDYYAKQEEYVTVRCYVRDTEDKKVPIGEVSISIGGYHVDIEQNPQMIGQSNSKDPGGCIFTFRVPPFIKTGVHELEYNYKGIKGYNNSYGKARLHVVPRIPTTTEYIYPNRRETWYYANDYDYFKDPVVEVKDANDYNVLHGKVRYYISNYEDEDEFVFIEFPIIFNKSILLERTVYMYCSSKILDKSLKFIFRVNHMFRPLDIIKLVDMEGEVIDYLEVGYEDKILFLTSTKYTKPYEYITKDGGRKDVDRNDDIDIQRLANSSIVMEVIE